MATYTTTNAPLPWMEPYLQDIAARGQEYANQPYQASPGTYTGPNDTLQSAWQLMANRAIQGSPDMSAARNTLFNTLNGGYMNRAATMNPYASQMNPYVDSANAAAGIANPYANAANAQAGAFNSFANTSNPNASIANEAANVRNDQAGAFNNYAGVTNPYADSFNNFAGVTNQAANVANPYAGMNNPYLNQTVADAQGDLLRSYNLMQKPAWDKAMQQSGSFGNTGVAEYAQNAQNDLLKNLGRISTDLRGNAYNLSANLAESQAGRQFQAGQQLQQNLYGAGQQQAQNLYNAGQQLQQNLYGAGQQQTQNLYNAGEAQAGRQFNAGSQLQSNLFNAGQQQAQNLYNAGQQQVGNLFNAGQQQAQNLYNAGAAQQSNLFNAGQQQAQNRFNAGNQFAQNMFGAGQDFAGRQDQIGNTERGYMNSALGLAPTFANQDYTDLNALLNAGNQQQTFNQANQNQQQAWWQEAQNYPLQRLQAYQSALNGNQGGTSTQNTPDPSTASSLLGGGLTAAAIYKMLFGG